MVEIDEDSEPLSQVRSRLAGYRDCPHAVLLVTPTASRASELLRLTDNPRLYATAIDRCVADPWGNHWRNRRVSPASLPDLRRSRLTGRTAIIGPLSHRTLPVPISGSPANSGDSSGA